MLSSLLISILTSAVFSLAVLLLVRRRLAPQFAEIFRRFAQIREVLKVLDGVKRDRAAMREGLGRLNRLAVAVSRAQVNAARRAAAAPCPPRRTLSPRLEHQLVNHWAPALGVPLEADEVRWMLRALQRTENLWLDDVPADAVDVVGRLVALRGFNQPVLRIADAGPAGGRLALFLQRAGAISFERIDVAHVGGGEALFGRMAAAAGASAGEARVFGSIGQLLAAGTDWDVLLLSAGQLERMAPADATALLAGVKAGGRLILGGEDTAPDGEELAARAAGLPGFVVVAAAWKTVVLRKLA